MDALMAVGGFVPLSYVFYGVIQNARQRRQLNGLGLFLAFFGVLLPVALITWGVLTGQSEMFLTLAALASAGVMILFGLIAVTQDARTGQSLNRSNGLMGVGAGLLILVAALVITQVLPLTGITGSSATTAMPANLAAMQQRFANATDTSGTPSETGSATASESSATTATLDTTLPSMPAGFALPALESSSGSESGAASSQGSGTAAAPAGFVLPALNTAAPSDTSVTTSAPSNSGADASVLTLDQFVSGVLSDVGEIEVTSDHTSTSQDTAAAGTIPVDTSATVSNSAVAATCQAVVRNNLNLRAEPGADSERLLTIPFSTLLTAISISDDNWWQVTYDGQTGWVSGDYLDIVGTCN